MAFICSCMRRVMVRGERVALSDGSVEVPVDRMGVGGGSKVGLAG